MIRSGVVVALVFPQLLVDVRRSLINRRDDCARGRIRLLAHMNRIGGKTHNALLALSHTCEAGSLRGRLRDRPRALPGFNCPSISFRSRFLKTYRSLTNPSNRLTRKFPRHAGAAVVVGPMPSSNSRSPGIQLSWTKA